MTAAERALVKSFEGRKSGGRLKTVSAEDLPLAIDAADGKKARGSR
jgi:hypothetical protein